MRHGRKPGGSDGGAGHRPRKTPPPEATGREASYLQRRKSDCTPMALRLVDGSTVRGRIENFDRDLITLSIHDGTNVVVRKADIRYTYEDSKD